MKRALIGIALASAACGAPSTPASPSAPNAPASPPALKASATTAETATAASIEIGADTVIGRDASGRELFRAKLKGARVAAPRPGGGAYVLTDDHVVRIDESGATRWESKVKRGGRLIATPTLVLLEASAHIDMLDANDGTYRGAIIADESGVSREGPAPEPSWRVPLRLFPGAPRRAERVLAVSADGLVLAGAADGSLVAIDLDGKPRFQLGVRGAVTDIDARPDGSFNVMTSAGAILFDPASAALKEPAPRSRPSLAYRARPSAPERAPELVLAPDDAWALESRYEGGARAQELHRFDGKTWRRIAMPQLDLMREPLFSGRREFHAHKLARGPDGQLLVIGISQLWSKVAPAMESVELRVFERAGATFRERPDLARAFAKTRQEIQSSARSPSYALGPGGREVICVVDACLARGLPPSFRPDKDNTPVPAGAPPWVYFEWPSGAPWYEARPMIFAGETLWRLDGSGLRRGGDLVHEGMPIDQIEQEFGPLGGSAEPLRALWASGEDDVWALMGISGHGTILMRWDGKELRPVKSPLRWAGDVWGSRKDDVWIAGDGAAHFDGKDWRRIAGVPGGAITGGSKGEVWIGGWRVTPNPDARPDLEGEPAPAPPIAAPSRALSIGPIDRSIRLERVTLDVAGDAPLTSALGIAEGTGNVVWLHDSHRIVEHDGAGARVLHRAPPLKPLSCQRCMAPRGLGEGMFLAPGSEGDMIALRSIAGGRAADALWLPALLSIARSPEGAVWAVSAADNDGSPRAVVQDATGLRLVAGLPPGAYADVAARAAADVWLAGGLAESHDGTRVWPEGEGTLVHFDGRRFTRHRAPDGALLSVAAVGPAEAWAVGMDGGVLHAKGDTVRAFHLEREGGAALRVVLRAVAAAGPDDVWIAGDRSTLLHWDGKALARVDTSAAGHDAALTAIIAPSARPGWVVGPSGMWRIARAAPSK
jgi:hypothetical protein